MRASAIRRSWGATPHGCTTDPNAGVGSAHCVHTERSRRDFAGFRANQQLLSRGDSSLPRLPAWSLPVDTTGALLR